MTKEFPLKALLALLAASGALALGGCNTTAGLGKDMKSAGKAVEETAEKAK